MTWDADTLRVVGTYKAITCLVSTYLGLSGCIMLTVAAVVIITVSATPFQMATLAAGLRTGCKGTKMETQRPLQRMLQNSRRL